MDVKINKSFFSLFIVCLSFLQLPPTVGQQPLAGRYLGWILFSFFLHFTPIRLALNHLARLADAGLLQGVFKLVNN